MTDRAKGIIVRFVNHKYFGFIAPEQGGDDVYFNIKKIRSEGVRTVSPGQSVEFTVRVGPQGPFAGDVVLGPIPIRKKKKGTLRWSEDHNSYGFISDEQGGSIFFHLNDIPTTTEGESTVSYGEQVEVEFEEFEDPKNKEVRAVNIRRIEVERENEREVERGIIMCIDNQEKSGKIKRENGETITFDHGDVWSEDCSSCVGQRKNSTKPLAKTAPTQAVFQTSPRPTTAAWRCPLAILGLGIYNVNSRCSLSSTSCPFFSSECLTATTIPDRLMVGKLKDCPSERPSENSECRPLSAASPHWIPACAGTTLPAPHDPRWVFRRLLKKNHWETRNE